MLMIKYAKVDACSYLPHLDTLRGFIRAIKRAEIQLNYSDGFHPHAQIFLSNPIPVGLTTLCEYITVDTTCAAMEFLGKINNFLPDGIRVEKAKDVTVNPNFAHIINFARYELELDDIDKATKFVANFSSLKSFVLNYNSKGKDIEKDVREFIKSAEIKNGKLGVVLGVGLQNVKIDRFCQKLSEILNVKITSIQKTNQFLQTLEDVDTLFENKKTTL